MAAMEVDEVMVDAPKVRHGAVSLISGRAGPRRGQLSAAEADAFVDQRFSSDLAASLKSFCSFKVPDAELNFLHAHPDLLVRKATLRRRRH